MSATNAGGATLTERDLELHARFRIPAELLAAMRVRRVTDAEARDLLCSKHRGDLAGILYPRIDPETGRDVGYRVRRDRPEMEDGRPRAKYLSSPDRAHLYFPPGANTLLSDTRALGVLVESEKAALASTAAATRADRPLLAIALGGVWGFRGRVGKTTDPHGARVDEHGPVPDLDRVTWRGRDVVILFDSNAATNTSVQAARRALARELTSRGARVSIGELPAAAGVNGPDDYLAAHGDAAFWSLLDGASHTQPKAPKPERPKQGREVRLEDPEPWATALAGDVLLDRIADTFTRYVAIPAHASVALALWVLHAYTLEAFFVSAVLGITSPVKRCGKTVLLMVLGALVPRRLYASNVTPAVLFRTIEKYAPTLLIDEADTFLRDNEELRGVLNSGHTRTTAIAIRAVGDDHEPRTFSTWCAKAIALIGKLPGTLEDRAIEIRMRRRLPGEHIERLRQDRIEAECAELRRQAARWAQDHRDALQHADPSIPPDLHDRAADCWRPLLAIADAAGAAWGKQARTAACVLSGVSEDADQPAAVLVLADLRGIMAAEAPRLWSTTKELVPRLKALEDRPWATWGREEKGLTGHALAKLLRPFSVYPISDGTARGYHADTLAEAWLRYLSPVEPSKCQNPNNDGPKPPIPQVSTHFRPDGSKTAETPIATGLLDTLTLPDPLRGDAGDDDADEL